MGNDLLIPVGPHLFDPTALQAALDRTIPTLPPGKTIAMVATADVHGASVAVVFQSQDGYWQAKAAITHDWTGDTSAAASVMFSK